MDLEIRPARLEDAEGLAHLLNEIIRQGGTTAHETPFTAADLDHAYISGPDALCCFMAVDRATGRPEGFQCLGRYEGLPEGIGDIGTFARVGGTQRGVGGVLFAATRAEALRLGLTGINATIRADNTGGLAFYGRMGFEDFSVRPAVPLKDGTPVDRVSKRYDLQVLFTPSGVRLRRHSVRRGPLNWLLLPGGPGIGSESLEELAAAITVPGAVWLVDLPGDGSNRSPPGMAVDPFAAWPRVVAEAARALPNVVFAGHSTGGMYLLATPELEGHILGLALLDTAPDARWHPRFVEMAAANPLPAVAAATEIYEADPRDESIAAVAVASAEWNFSPAGLAAGRDLLARMPYNSAAVAWSDANFDHTYAAAWWPTDIPVLILAGDEDRIVWQGGWSDARFHGPHVVTRAIAGAGHFPWIENPGAVRDAFGDLAERIAIPEA